jgi:hypothetical protein
MAALSTIDGEPTSSGASIISLPEVDGEAATGTSTGPNCSGNEHHRQADGGCNPAFSISARVVLCVETIVRMVGAPAHGGGPLDSTAKTAAESFSPIKAGPPESP